MQFMFKLSLRTLLSPCIITRRFDKKIRQPEGLAGGPGKLWISGATFGAHLRKIRLFQCECRMALKRLR